MYAVYCSYVNIFLFPRYFNAWVESGHLHIQTEFCEGGSLEAKAGLFLLLLNYSENIFTKQGFDEIVVRWTCVSSPT